MIQKKLETIMESDSNQKDENGYRISSIYFDTLDDRCLKEAQEGIRFRKKYRIRIYNGSFDTIKLEVKYKADSRIMKKGRTITYEQMLQLLNGDIIDADTYHMDDSVTLFNLAIQTEGLRPKVVVDYYRKAFVFEPGNVRITLDRRINANEDFDSFCSGNMSGGLELLDEECILEVKYDEFLPNFIAGVLESGYMNQIAFSKYKLCCERLENKYVN